MPSFHVTVTNHLSSCLHHNISFTLTNSNLGHQCQNRRLLYDPIVWFECLSFSTIDSREQEVFKPGESHTYTLHSRNRCLDIVWVWGDWNSRLSNTRPFKTATRTSTMGFLVGVYTGRNTGRVHP
jgi:hypothetical protein